MDFWEAIPQMWGPVSQHFGYVRDINNNVTTLMKETGKLKRKRDEIRDEVNAAESVGKKRRCDVGEWLRDVDEIVPEVNSIQLEFERGTTNVLSRYRLGRRVAEKIEVVKTLQDKGAFDEAAKSPPLMTKWQVPTELEQQETAKETLEQISQWLKDEDVGVISVWGMGGVGKTTLIKEIHNRSHAMKDFHQVIWVTVSKDLDLEVIKKRIGKKLNVEFWGNEDREDLRLRLYARLSNLRYMLILDDLWHEFSLDDVGIPQPNKENRCKIVITTRLNEVSNAMEADRKIKIIPLGSEEAWNLFCSKTENVILLPEIRPLAEKVVKECGGLPLAIITVGRAMRQKDRKELWQNALRALKRSAPEIRGMEPQVFLPLKLSYDCIEDPTIQACFLYCSLYPEDFEIDTESLVRYWAFEEGLISNVNSFDDAFDRVHDILEKLKDACLLEEGTQGNGYVRMHDLLRDLAIWITSPSSSCFQAPKFLVKAGEGLEQPPEEKMWEGMERISLMRNEIKELQMKPSCPDLVSLFLCENKPLHTIHDSFFHLMPKLQILDLRETDIKALPPSLSLLANLRVLIANRCTSLQEMPPLGHLKELQLLDLSLTGIESLPQGIASLAKLRILDLSQTKALATIPGDIISGLTSLEDLGLHSIKQMMSMEIWREVATLRRLTCLRIALLSLDAFSANDMKHPMWSRLSGFYVQFGLTHMYFCPSCRERLLFISRFEEFPIQINGLTEKAEKLIIWQCKSLESLSQIIGDSTSMQKAGENNALDRLEKPSLQRAFDGGPPKGFQQLRRIEISDCPKLRCIFSSSMLQRLHPLETLTVLNCEEIVEIVEGGPLPDTALQRLWYLQLSYLPKLKTICSQQLVLTSMNEIWINDCHELKLLPVLCSGIQEIRGEMRASREWWKGIEWEDEHSKSLYSSIYEEREDTLQEVDEQQRWQGYFR